jgi:hypothetical protein
MIERPDGPDFEDIEEALTNALHLTQAARATQAIGDDVVMMRDTPGALGVICRRAASARTECTRRPTTNAGRHIPTR